MIDIDGTIAELKKQGQTYENVKINEGAVSKIKALKKAGHYIILQTARHMKTCNGDQGQVIAKIGKQTLDWLKINEIPYDEIYFGKPYADVYIDDLAHQFTAWHDIKVQDFDDSLVNIVIPMAGLGSRFAKAGFVEPKPLIDVLGEPMISWAMKSFDFLSEIPYYRLIFIILREHEELYSLSSQLKKLFGEKAEVIYIERVSRGQAETVLAAKQFVNNYNKLFIFNCDTYSTANIWPLILEENPDGILACFESTDPRYSYAKLDEYGYVLKTAEKNPISNLASNGMYYFKRGKDFINAAEKLAYVTDTSHSELYVAPCYNELLLSGKKIRVVKVTKNHVLGTPEELKKFISEFNFN